jgi:hypothetical protein
VQEERIDYQDMTGLVEGARHSPDERFRKIHDCEASEEKTVVGKTTGSTEAQGFQRVQISEKKHALMSKHEKSVSFKRKRKCD